MKTTAWYFNKVTDMEISVLYKYINPHTNNKRVLDLGCGVGRYLEYFSEDSVGLDASYSNIQIVKEKGLKIKFCDLNDHITYNDNTFDIILCSHLLEHVESPINLLKECNRVLKDDGLLFVILPNESNLPNLLYLDDYFGNHPEHLYAFTIKNIEVLLKKAGFEKKSFFLSTYLLKKVSKRLPLFGSFFLGFIQKLPRKVVLPFSDEYMIIGKK